MSRPPRFVWRTADGAEHAFEVTANEISVGRAPTCDIILADDQMVSRRHAVMRRQSMACTMVDLGSSNGTLVNGIEIHDATLLKEGDRVTIGDQDLIFNAGQEAAHAPEMAHAGSPAQSFGQAPAWSPPPMETFAAPATPNAIVEVDTGALGAVADPGFGQHNGNGHPTTEPDAGSYQYQQNYDYNQYYAPQPQASWQQPASAPAPQQPVSGPIRQDAASLVQSIETQLAQLKGQLATANGESGQVREAVRSTLAQLDMALRTAQSASQQSALADLQQLAGNLSASPMIDQAAAFARRAGEIRDVLAAHQDLLNALATVRRQLDQAANA